MFNHALCGRGRRRAVCYGITAAMMLSEPGEVPDVQ